ncbi:MAG TPA: hypothetical protein VIM00_11590, partial [Candidatus Acidoferrum sp.]
IQSETLTTFAGLLIRNLLDYFDGDIMKAVGAYNGGPGKPNAGYAKSVRNVARYARQVIMHGAAMASVQPVLGGRRLRPRALGNQRSRRKISRRTNWAASDLKWQQPNLCGDYILDS